MPSDRITWAAKLPPQKDEQLQEIVDKREINKSDLIKNALDDYVESQGSYTWAEEQLLDVATYSALSTMVLVAAIVLQLLPYAFWQLGVVLTAIAAAAAVAVRTGVIGDE